MSRPVLGCDPGYRESAFVIFNGKTIDYYGTLSNEDALLFLGGSVLAGTVLVIEQMQLFTSNYGVGQEIFDSCFWSGRFVQVWTPRKWDRILRSKIRGHLGASKGGDAAVRAALIGRFGPYKETAIGTKKTPGPCYGISGHEWQALAVAVTWYDLFANKPEEIRMGIVPEF
jgi:hypothetical protein